MNEELTSLAKRVSKHEEIQQIAQISANNDVEIGAIIAEAMKKVGKDGTITIAEAKGIDTTLDVVEGLQFDKGYLSPYFITNPEKMTAELDNALILVTDKRFPMRKNSSPFWRKSWNTGKSPFSSSRKMSTEKRSLPSLSIN